MSTFYNILKEKAINPKYDNKFVYMGRINIGNNPLEYGVCTYKEFLQIVDDYIAKIKEQGCIANDDIGKERYVILGRHVENNKIRYDYLCLVYPYGYHDNSEFLYINDSDVTSMYFLGDINYK